MRRAKGGAALDEMAAAVKFRQHTVKGALAGALGKKLGVEGPARVQRLRAAWLPGPRQARFRRPSGAGVYRLASRQCLRKPPIFIVIQAPKIRAQGSLELRNHGGQS
jgi:hypothetical protein